MILAVFVPMDTCQDPPIYNLHRLAWLLILGHTVHFSLPQLSFKWSERCERHQHGDLSLYEEILSEPNPAGELMTSSCARPLFSGLYISLSIILAVMDFLGVLSGGRGVFILYWFFFPLWLLWLIIGQRGNSVSIYSNKNLRFASRWQIFPPKCVWD